MFFYVKHFDSENFDTVTEKEFSSASVKDNLKFQLGKKYSVTKNGVTKVVVIVHFSDKIEELNEKIKTRSRLPPKKFIQSESELDIEKTKAEVKENTQEEIEEFDKLLEEKMTDIVHRQEELNDEMTEENEENLSLNKILNIKKEKETNSDKSLQNEMVDLMNKSNDEDRQILLPKEKKNKQKKKSKKSKNEKDAEKVSKPGKKQKHTEGKQTASSTVKDKKLKSSEEKTKISSNHESKKAEESSAQRLNKETANQVKGDMTAEAEATKTVNNSEDVDKVQPHEFIDDRTNEKLESSTILEKNDPIKTTKRAGSMIDEESSNAKIPKLSDATKAGMVSTSEIQTNKSMDSITSTKIDTDLKKNKIHDAVKVNKKESSEKKIKELTIKLNKALKDAKKFESKWKDEKDKNLQYRETLRKKNDELKIVQDLNHQWQFKVLDKVDDYAKAEVNPFTSIIKSDASIGALRLSNRTGDERPVMMMHCGNNIWIEEVAYHNAKNKGATAKNSCSQFVKEIALTIIGIEVLKEATPTGKPCNRTIKAKQKAGIEVKAKKKIDPILLGAVYGIFQHYLAKERNMDPIEAAAEIKKVHSYLSQKNYDLNLSQERAKNGPNSNKKKKTRVNKKSKNKQKDTEESESEEEDKEDENGPNSDKKKTTRVNKRAKKNQKDKKESESEKEDSSVEINKFKENTEKKYEKNTNEESEDTDKKNKDKDKNSSSSSSSSSNSSSSSSSSSSEAESSDMDVE